ncbi:MAG TPA: ISAs1 family transposase [Gammaproteobacteria bacterium]|nr:ISAs1 family transposase [Gammaproteobacteria bacterium]
MNFLEHFQTLDDPRSHINRKHDLLDILFLTLSAILSGSEGWEGIEAFGQIKLDWLKKYRGFENGIPRHDTIARVISALEPEQFVQCFMNWVNEVRQANGQDVIAIDGKTLRRSHDGERKAALHLISAYCCETGLVLTQAESKGKKNEIKTVPDVLDLLALSGCTVTLDAMSCQKKIVEKIRAKGAHYVVALKGNQGNLEKEVKAWIHKLEREEFTGAAHQCFEQIEKGHGRIEERYYRQIIINDWLSAAVDWKDLTTLIEVKRTRHHKNKISNETQYYISSLPLDAVRAGKAIRSHWAIENRSHWVLDVTFSEDNSRIRRNNAPENMAAIRRFVMNLVKIDTTLQASMKRKRQMAGWDDEFRAKLLFGG